MEEKLFITKEVHDEFSRRIDDENSRQNRRIAALEENAKEIHKLTVSMERMSVNMENMLVAIERQGNLIEKQNSRIDGIEREPADTYKSIKMLIITTIVSAIVGGFASQLISLL